MYIAPLDISAANLADADNDQDVFVLASGSANKVIIHEFELYSDSNTASTLKLSLVRRSGGGTGGSTVTEEPLDPDNTVTNTANLTTDVEAPGTLTHTLATYLWEQLGPLVHRPCPEDRVIMDTSDFLALHLSTAPGTISLAGFIVWEEI
jgi:hypothetical protein